MSYDNNRTNSESASPFKVLDSREVYRNRWISVREDKVIRPGGGNGIFGIVSMKPGSSVLAITKELDVFLVKEFKYAVARETLEVVSGALDDDEAPLDAARRELEEEIGARAGEWIALGRIDPFTTVVDSPNYMFVALDLTFTSQHLDSGEVLSVIRVPFAEALESVLSGRITHGASCVVILRAEAILRSRGLVR